MKTKKTKEKKGYWVNLYYHRYDLICFTLVLRVTSVMRATSAIWAWVRLIDNYLKKRYSRLRHATSVTYLPFVGHVFNVTVKLYNVQNVVLGGGFLRLSSS